MHFKGHVSLDQVRPKKICEALTYLKYNYQLYSDFQIDEDNILQLLVTVCTEEIPNDTAIEDENELSNSKN